MQWLSESLRRVIGCWGTCDGGWWRRVDSGERVLRRRALAQKLTPVTHIRRQASACVGLGLARRRPRSAQFAKPWRQPVTATKGVGVGVGVGARRK